ncbi:4'-phosphopantetheinyl transferase family protein [Nannocystis bainbridge]|uniref:4'-phosphopantetheinyl transferase superfamily protein n=1 Tax=Nannocystis bainbridge TaxID=2995303 RepID=A0ABT5EDP6_9BACT|nr:4'-phosphopantetheinyl transferase superfamily protein [Nannocystis bainbridge]MDC0722957.1 4'-phosphopantetheinyl transferase superfamily protein [Nannocystis bainbridge]
MTERQSLAPGEVHVWLCAAETQVDADWLAAARGLLNPEEQARQDRFVFERNRRQFAVARVLVRQILAGYTGIAAAELRFVANEYGRPALALAGALEFNLSHTDGLAALAVTRVGEIGVDVEDAERRARPEEVADHFFAPSEVAGLMALETEQRRARFFDLWTLKEAYIKARGMGLAIPLDAFAYDLSRGRAAIDLAIDASLGDPRAGWEFFLEDPTPRHRLALAARLPAREPARITYRWVGPAGHGRLGLRDGP